MELVGHKLRRGLHNMDLTGIPAPYLKLSEYERAYDIWQAKHQDYSQAKQLLLGYDTAGLLKLDAHAENSKFQSRKALATVGKRQYALNSMQDTALVVQHNVEALRAEIAQTLHNLRNYGQGAQHLSLPTALKQARFYLQAIEQHNQLVQDIRSTNDCAWQQFYATGNASDAAYDQRGRLEMLWRDLNQTNLRVADMRLLIDRIQDAGNEAEDVLEHVRNLSGYVVADYQELGDLGQRIGQHLNQSFVDQGEQLLSRSAEQQMQLNDQRLQLSASAIQLNDSLLAQVELQREVRRHWLPKAEKHAGRLLERANEYARQFQPTKNGARIAMLAR